MAIVSLFIDIDTFFVGVVFRISEGKIFTSTAVRTESICSGAPFRFEQPERKHLI